MKKFLIQGDANGAYTTGATSLATGSVTPPEANELVVIGFTFGGNSGSASVSGFTVSSQIAGVAGAYYGGGMAYQIQTTATTVNPTVSWSSGTYIALSIATFKAAPGASATGGIKVWSGSSFDVKPVKVWTGSAWAVKEVKFWNGSSWVVAP